MSVLDDLVLVNYCYPDCTPLMNIMRLPEAEAIRFAHALAESHPDTTAFYRFADFENYYPRRKKQDDYLYSRFIELGGAPEEKHPLSFVVAGSDYLRDWFGNGIETRLPLKDIAPCHVSFTIGDSGYGFQKNGYLDVLTVDRLIHCIDSYKGDFDAFLHSTGRNYVEAQLWSDEYIK